MPTDDRRGPGSDGQRASDDASRAAGTDALPETGADAEQDLAMDDAGIGDPGTDTADTAAASALTRAREAARAKGLRPGSRPTRKRRVPGQQRDDSAGSGRDPSLLGDQMDRLLLDRGWNLDVAVGAVMGRWSEIVGPNVAEHCKPVTFSDGVLTVRADSTAWTTQMRLMSSSDPWPAGDRGRQGRRHRASRAGTERAVVEPRTPKIDRPRPARHLWMTRFDTAARRLTPPRCGLR